MEKWVKSADYTGPDRRQSNQGPPAGEQERRSQETEWVEPPSDAAQAG